MSGEIAIDEPLVRGLLAEQHPDLADLPIQRTAIGWDNELWRLGPSLVVRLPRRRLSTLLVAKEIRWLPDLTPRLPLPTPTPVRIGQPTARFPYQWYVARWVEGQPADVAPVCDGERSAKTLAAFLRALHQPAPPEAPANMLRGSVPLDERTASLSEHLDAVRGRIDVDRARRAWEVAISAPVWDGPPLWVHGDLHPANILTTRGAIAGVVDFGDLCAGDPANDLAAAWILLPSKVARLFLDEYGCIDNATMERARGWALFFAVMLLSIGQAGERGLPGGKPTWLPAGYAALDRVQSS